MPPTTHQKEYLDVVKLLVRNYRENKPLLEDAVLFRGSRFGDGAPAKDTPDKLHAHLLPQVAASYTHSWKKGDSFIDTYPIDRENTKFYANFNLAEHLKGESVRSYTVQEAERAIRPLVENLAYLPANSQAWDRNVEALEKFIKSSFYEAGVPVHRTDGTTNQPTEKFYYTGGPKVTSAKEVIDKLERLTPENEARAKALYALARPSEAAKAIAKLEVTHPEAANAFKVLQQAVQRDQATNVLTKYGKMPLNDFIATTRVEPQTEAQSRVLRLAQGLAHSLSSPDPAVRSRALAVTRHIGTLDPATATMKDVGQAVSRVTLAAQNGKQIATQQMPPTARAPASSTLQVMSR